MSDDFTQLNRGTGGDYMDETGVTYPTSPTTRKRARIQVGGADPDSLAEVSNSPPVGNEYGLIVRGVMPTYPGTPVAKEGESNLVAATVETTIVSYTVPSGKEFGFTGIVASGDVSAIFRVYINNVRIFAYRNSVANPSVLVSFPYSPFGAAQGSLVEIRGTHWSSGIQANFEATLLGYSL